MSMIGPTYYIYTIFQFKLAVIILIDSIEEIDHEARINSERDLREYMKIIIETHLEIRRYSKLKTETMLSNLFELFQAKNINARF